MSRHIAGRSLWRSLLRGLLVYGACVGGSANCLAEWERDEDAMTAEPCDWSIPYQWYDSAHRPGHSA